MGKLRLHRLLALLLVTACTGQTTTVVIDVASVVLSPSPASVEVGVTLQFQASAFDAGGTPITGQPVTWESTVPGVATISADGVALGVTAGSTQIRATIGGVRGTQSLTVNPTPCTTRTTVTLSPGQYGSYPGGECLLLPAGVSGDLYRVAIARPNLIEDTTNVPVVTLDMAPVLVPAAVAEAPQGRTPPQVSPVEDGLPLLDGTRALRHLQMMEATRRFHNELRLRERRLGLDVGPRLPNRARAGAPPAPVDPPATRNMFLDITCLPQTPRAVRLIGFDDNLAVYQETAEWNTDPIEQADVTKLLAYFENYVKDMIKAYWGAVPDTDGNDGRMIVVTTPSLDEGAAAAVFSGDLLPTTSCPSSNQAEVIYFQGPLLVALDDADPNPFALGVLAHEAKHVISLYNGLQRPSGFNELWIEEGTAEVSQVMSSRIAWAATGGPALGVAITRAHLLASIQANGGRETDEMSALVDQLAGLVFSLSAQPNSVTVDPVGAPASHSFYSNSWHWHRFLGDAFGNASTPLADSSFFRQITSPTTPAGGAAGEVQVTGRSFTQLFEDFVVAVSLHQTGHNPTYEIDTWNFVSAGDVFSTPNPPGSYPWPVTAVASQSWVAFGENSYTGTMGPSGVRFHDFRSSGTASAQIHVSGANNGVIIVTRID